MTAMLIITGLVVLGVGGTVAFDALRRPGDQRDPEQPRNVEKLRAHSEAEAAAPVSEADEAEAAQLVDEISTGEFPALAFDVDPLAAPIPIGHTVADPALFNASAAAWLLPAWPTTPTVPLASVQVPEPDPLQLDGPTVVWHRDWINQVLAGGPR